MRAMTLPAYGAPQLRDIAPPVPGDDDLLVDVVAASINAADGHVVRGDPFPIRLALGLRRPKLRAPGADVSGRVRAAGSRVTGFAPGDEVVADLSGVGFGAFAEQVSAPARVWVRKPPGLSFIEAAAIPMAGMTALKGLRDVAKVRAGEQVLVVGAAGGVGSFAVQIARAFGAEVTAACSADKADAVGGLGVTRVLDTGTLGGALSRGELDDRFDLVFDCAAYRSPFAYRRALRRQGRLVLVGGSMAALMKAGLLGALVGAVSGRRYRTFFQTADAVLLGEVLALVEQGKVRPLVDRTFPLEDVPAALRHLGERHARGKIVISVSP